jgi:hypothetical protein
MLAHIQLPSIEMCLHRIPGLSRRFLYLNDDFFLGRAVQPSDFFTPGGGQVIFVDDFPLSSDPRHGAARDRACAYTQNILTQRWGDPPAPRLNPAHAPQAYDRDVLFRLERLFQDEFRKTAAHRFRSGEDLALNVLYGYTVLESAAERGPHQMRVLPGFSRHYRFFILERRYLRTMHAYVRILWQRPRFLSMNDDLDGAPPHHPCCSASAPFCGCITGGRVRWSVALFRRE